MRREKVDLGSLLTAAGVSPMDTVRVLAALEARLHGYGGTRHLALTLFDWVETQRREAFENGYREREAELVAAESDRPPTTPTWSENV